MGCDTRDHQGRVLPDRGQRPAHPRRARGHRVPTGDEDGVSEAEVLCQFDLAGVEPGAWNVVVENPDHSVGQLTNGLYVESSPVAAWGYNAYGQTTVPAPNSGFVAISAGGYYSLGLRSNGSITAWGRSDLGQLSIPAPNSDFVSISAGTNHGLGLKSDGSIVAWGLDNYHQVGYAPTGTDFVAVAGGAFHSLGLKSDGSIVAWGRNLEGQCDVPFPNSGFMPLRREPISAWASSPTVPSWPGAMIAFAR